MRRLCCAFLATVAATAGVAVASTNAPPAFHLVFDGKHTPALLHEGPFTTTSTYCPSGHAEDVKVDDVTLTVLRRFTCDGSGEAFTARVAPLPAEHGGSGTWQIISGTGVLADLRGKGLWSSERLSGSPDDPATITFRSTWDGVADFDAAAPEITITAATARRLSRPKGASQLRLKLSIADAAGVASYVLLVLDPRHPTDPLASRSSRAGGTIPIALRVRPKKGARLLRVHVDATDPYGNASSTTTTVRIRRS